MRRTCIWMGVAVAMAIRLRWTAPTIGRTLIRHATSLGSFCAIAVLAALLAPGAGQVLGQNLADALNAATYPINNWDFNAAGGTGNWTWNQQSTWTDANGNSISAPINAPGSRISVEPRVQNVSTTISIAQDITIGHLTARTHGDGGKDVIIGGAGTITFDTGDGSESLYTSYRTWGNWTLGVNRPWMHNNVILNNDLRVIKNISNIGGGINSPIIGSASGPGKLWIEIGSRDSGANSRLGLNQPSYHTGGTEVSPMLGTYGDRLIPHANININVTGAFGMGHVTIRDDNAGLVGGTGNFRVAFLADQVLATTASLYLYTTGNNLRLTLGDGTNTTVAGLFVNDVEQPLGTYSGGSLGWNWLLGTGTLTVASLTDPYLAVWDTDPVWSEAIVVLRDAGQSYAGVYSYTDPGQNDPPNAVSLPGVGTLVPGGTVAELWDGAASSATSVTMEWRARTAAERTMAGGGLISDIMSLTGMAAPAGASGDQVDPFVLAMSFTWDDLEEVWGEDAAGPYLAYLDEAEQAWVRAVDGNVGGAGNYLALADYDPATHALGDYGYSFDGEHYFAWAVLNHNSQFAVTAVPEPAALLLLCAGLAGLLLGYRPRRR